MVMTHITVTFAIFQVCILHDYIGRNLYKLFTVYNAVHNINHAGQC